MLAIGVMVIYARQPRLAYRLYHTANEAAIMYAARENTHFIETLRGMPSIKAMVMGDRRQAAWNNYLVDHVGAELRVQKLDLVFKTVNTVLFGIDRIVIIYLGRARCCPARSRWDAGRVSRLQRPIFPPHRDIAGHARSDCGCSGCIASGWPTSRSPSRRSRRLVPAVHRGSGRVGPAPPGGFERARRSASATATTSRRSSRTSTSTLPPASAWRLSVRPAPARRPC